MNHSVLLHHSEPNFKCTYIACLYSVEHSSTGVILRVLRYFQERFFFSRRVTREFLTICRTRHKNAHQSYRCIQNRRRKFSTLILRIPLCYFNNIFVEPVRLTVENRKNYTNERYKITVVTLKTVKSS